MDLLKHSYLGLLPLLLTGCYEEFDPKIDTTPVLCLNSLITAGCHIDVNVSHSWLYTDTTGEHDNSVKDAVVSIYANGEAVDADYIPKEGDRIRIHASSSTYGEAHAEVTVPVTTVVSETDFTTTVNELWINDYAGWGVNADLWFDIQISMNLHDAADTDEFHRLVYETFSKGGIMTNNGEYPTDSRSVYTALLSSGNFDAIDPVFHEYSDPFEEALNGGGYMTFFSDTSYNGEKKKLTFGFSSCCFHLSGWKGDPEDMDCGWELTLYSISDSYYNWLSYCEQSGGIVFGDFSSMGFADPIWGYSNVSTGAGVVAAQSSVTVRINIKDFLRNVFDKHLD